MSTRQFMNLGEVQECAAVSSLQSLISSCCRCDSSSQDKLQDLDYLKTDSVISRSRDGVTSLPWKPRAASLCI
jgi:hypothetical protein